MAKKILKVVGIAAAPFTGGASLALTAGASMLGGKKSSAPATTTDNGPKVMPLADDEAVKRARRVSMQRQMQRGGRSSTMLSDSANTLGGGML